MCFLLWKNMNLESFTISQQRKLGRSQLSQNNFHPLMTTPSKNPLHLMGPIWWYAEHPELLRKSMEGALDTTDSSPKCDR